MGNAKAVFSKELFTTYKLENYTINGYATYTSTDGKFAISVSLLRVFVSIDYWVLQSAEHR